MKLILSKVLMPHEMPQISRRRLLDMLQDGLDAGTATVLNGRAGTGKTMLAADFARCCGRCVAWYKVDASDANPMIFWSYLLESVARVYPGFGADYKTRNHLLSGTLSVAFNVAALVEAFVHELEVQTGPLLLVLDDLHLIYDAEWATAFFHRLLLLLPVETHLLILSRGLPPMPLWRLRSRQKLLVINEPMLAFTLQEAEELLASYRLSEQQAALCLKQTRGRAAVLHSMAIRNFELSLEEMA